MKLTEIDVESELKIGKDRVDGTQDQYDLWLGRFVEFCSEDFVSGADISADLLVDRTMAAFLIAHGKKNDWKAPHVKKAIISSLNYALQLKGLPNLCDGSDQYPLFTRTKKVRILIIYMT